MTTPISRNLLKLAAPAFLLAVAQYTPAQAADFQQYLQGNCNGTVCTVNFDAVPTGKTLRVGKASCYLRAETEGQDPWRVLHALQLLVVKPNGTAVMAETLPAEMQMAETLLTTIRTVHQSNESVQISARGGQHIQAYAELSADSTLQQFACHISGNLS